MVLSFIPNSKNGSLVSRSCHHLRRIRAFSGSLTHYHNAAGMSNPSHRFSHGGRGEVR